MIAAPALRIPPRPEMVLGAGAIDDVPDLVRLVGGDAAFVVTDAGLVAAGAPGRLAAALEAAGLRTGVHDAVGPNPGVADVLAGSAALRAHGPSVVVALGGGSVIDAAKAISLHAANGGPPETLADRIGSLAPGVPLIGVPTTAGTGAETNAFGVIDDPAARRKRYVGHASVLPRVAVLDPELTVTAPPHVTAACGVDVLAHAIESMQARRGNDYAAALALEAVRLVAARLPAVVADGRDLPGREALLLAAHLAGLAFATTGLGTAHALGHALSARYGTPHGVALAAVLPGVVRLNVAERPHPSARLAEVLVDGDLPDAVAVLQERAGLRPALRDLGVPHRDLGAIADAALADAVIANAPRLPSRAELVRLLDAAR